jgi:lipopolysaccharide/colanic/teichoic acid biosynthesis glycosyltransferase
MIYKKYFKRPLDFFLALCGLIVLSPILIIAIIVIAVSFRENPFFTQVRPGKHEKLFSVLKLKTMNSKKTPTEIYCQIPNGLPLWASLSARRQ